MVAGLHEHCFGEHLADQAELYGSNFPFIAFEEMGEQGHYFDAQWDRARYSGHNDHIVANRQILSWENGRKTSKHKASTMKRKRLPGLHFLVCTYGDNMTSFLKKMKEKKIYDEKFTESPEIVFQGELPDLIRVCFCGQCVV